jgi:hypothetical protein
VRAYVSYVRFYTKHTMTSIFRMSEFDFVGFGLAYGLLRLPSMPELKSAHNIPEKGWLVEDIDASHQSCLVRYIVLILRVDGHVQIQGSSERTRPSGRAE